MLRQKAPMAGTCLAQCMKSRDMRYSRRVRPAVQVAVQGQYIKSRDMRYSRRVRPAVQVAVQGQCMKSRDMRGSQLGSRVVSEAGRRAGEQARPLRGGLRGSLAEGCPVAGSSNRPAVQPGGITHPRCWAGTRAAGAGGSCSWRRAPRAQSCRERSGLRGRRRGQAVSREQRAEAGERLAEPPEPPAGCAASAHWGHSQAVWHVA